jgi:hypothetical protein
MDPVSESLIAAQNKAAALFAEVADSGMIRAGKLESELTADIHALAQSRFDVRRHWHRRIARSGPNTLLTYYDEPPDRRIADDDVVYLDFGPLFGEWEADFGRTYALGADPVKHRLVGDIEEAFRRGKEFVLMSDRPRIPSVSRYATATKLRCESRMATVQTATGYWRFTSSTALGRSAVSSKSC